MPRNVGFIAARGERRLASPLSNRHVPFSWPQGTVGAFSRVRSNRPSTGRKGYAMNALSPLGMVSELPSSNQMPSDAERTLPNGSGPNHPDAEVQKDYFVEKDGVKFAGVHLLVDLWGASNLCD